MSFFKAVVIVTIFAGIPLNYSFAQTGIVIRGGILNDYPSHEIFDDMETGFGYIAGIGYDIFPKIGLDIGVLNSTHEYRFDVVGGAVRTKNAEKTAFFIRGHYSPLKLAEYEIQLSAGAAYYDIRGDLETFLNSFRFVYEKSYSGWGYTLNVDFMHYITENFAVTFLVSANLVDYGSQSVNPYIPGETITVPRGDSYGWGITLFYRVGKPNIN